MDNLVHGEGRFPQPLLVQAHWTDFECAGELIRHPAIGLVAKARAHFDPVVLVCADVAENRVVHEFAAGTGVASYAGSPLDVCQRMLGCMGAHRLHTGARVLAYHFMLDFPYVDECFAALHEQDAEYVAAPTELDTRFAADVFTRQFLEHVQKELPAVPSHEAKLFRFNPWAMAEVYPERFRLGKPPPAPHYGKESFQKLRRTIDQWYPERHRRDDRPLTAYLKTANALPKDTRRVADVACGWGEGTAYLAGRFPEVVGVDYDPRQVEHNCDTYRGRNNLTFQQGDAGDPELFPPGSLDAVVSIHSMEHFPDDRLFLANCHRWLRPGGTLVLEVPLLMTHPFPGIDQPLGSGHIREYRPQDLLALCGEFFCQECAWGVSRGMYVALERARNAAMLVLRKLPHAGTGRRRQATGKPVTGLNQGARMAAGCGNSCTVNVPAAGEERP